MIYPIRTEGADRVIGQLYGREHASELSEDMLLVKVGTRGIDVRWWPSYSTDGKYVVREFEGKWSNKVGGFQTKDPLEVKAFVERRVRELARRPTATESIVVRAVVGATTFECERKRDRPRGEIQEVGYFDSGFAATFDLRRIFPAEAVPRDYRVSPRGGTIAAAQGGEPLIA